VVCIPYINKLSLKVLILSTCTLLQTDKDYSESA